MKIVTPVIKISDDLHLCWNLSNLATKRLLKSTILAGFFAAIIEYVFATLLQAFFKTLGYLSELTTLTDQNLSSSQILLFLLIISVIRSFVDGFKIFVSRIAQQKFAQYVRIKIISLTLNNPKSISSGRVISLFSDETNRASNSILNFATICINFTLAISLLSFCIIQFPLATLMGVILLIICYLPLKLYERATFKQGLFLSEEWENTNQVLLEGIRNNFYLKIIGMIEDEILRASKYLSVYLSKYKKAFLLISLRASLPSLFGMFILVTIAFIHQKLNFFGNNFKFLEFFYIFLRFTQAISQTVTSAGDFKINAESAHRLDKWFKENKEIKESPGPGANVKLDDFSISAINLSYGYDGKKLFENINFDLKLGDILVIRGESGSGKSTLIQLILGLTKPDYGEILICGNHLNSIKKYLISEIAYVGPHAFIIEGTVLDNLKYGNQKHVSEEDINQAIKISALDKVINDLPDGLNTSLNEHASRLSTGQKQRLMIARALLRKPKLLIFDEGTANLDDLTEAQFISNLNLISDKFVSIIVTHKDSFNKSSTHQLVLKSSTSKEAT